MLNRKILIVDDEPAVQQSLGMVLKNLYELHFAGSGEECFEKLRKATYDLIILDLRLPGKSGLEILKDIRFLAPSTPVLMLTAVDDTRSAVEAMKLGAVDYLLKPFDVEEMKLVVERVITQQELREKVIKLEEEVSRVYRFENIVGKSPGMQKVFRRISQVMNQDATVLILGENGTGKELVARAVHYNGIRKHGPFIPVDCTSIPKELLESELFGHEKGAFTGAHQRKKGTFELAHGGTMFLDEIGELPLEIQSKLLRVIQEREFRRVGGSEAVRVDVRLITATNRNLEKMMADGQFRKDLYYRIHVVPILLPPLRERKEDIPLLAHHFLKTMNKKTRGCVQTLSSDLILAFIHYDWPGNVRELANFMERLLITVEESELKASHFRALFHEMEGFQEHVAARLTRDFSLENATLEFEKKLIEDALKICNGAIGQTADRLRTTRRILKYRMEKLGIQGATD